MSRLEKVMAAHSSVSDHLLWVGAREGRGGNSEVRPLVQPETGEPGSRMEALKHALPVVAASGWNERRDVAPWYWLVACGLPQSRRRKPKGPQMQRLCASKSSLWQRGDPEWLASTHSQLEKPFRLLIFWLVILLYLFTCSLRSCPYLDFLNY